MFEACLIFIPCSFVMCGSAWQWYRLWCPLCNLAHAWGISLSWAKRANHILMMMMWRLELLPLAYLFVCLFSPLSCSMPAITSPLIFLGLLSFLSFLSDLYTSLAPSRGVWHYHTHPINSSKQMTVQPFVGWKGSKKRCLFLCVFPGNNHTSHV